MRWRNETGNEALNHRSRAFSPDGVIQVPRRCPDTGIRNGGELKRREGRGGRTVGGAFIIIHLVVDPVWKAVRHKLELLPVGSVTRPYEQ